MALYPSFIFVTKANQLVGSVVEPANTLVQVDSTVRDAYVAAGQGLALDLLPASLVDLAKAGFANAAAVALTFTGTTPITLDLTNLVAATGVVVSGVGTFAGSFASWAHILVQNIGSGTKPFSVAPGGSNPLRTALGGTSPTHTLQTSDAMHWYNSTALVVDSTHKTLTFTPTSAGSGLVFIAGS
jgi:hypothetical protein